MPCNTLSLKKSAFTALFAAVFLASPLASAGKGHGDKGDSCKGKEKHFFSIHPKIKEQLNLTEEQKNKLKATKETYGREAMKKQHEAMEKAQKELEATLKSDASDEKVREKFEALHKIQEQFARLRFEKILVVRSILTPEQRLKFKDLIGK